MFAEEKPEIEDNHRALKNAIATQRLAGLALDGQTIHHMCQMAMGELELSDVLAILRSRLEAGEFKSPDGT